MNDSGMKKGTKEQKKINIEKQIVRSTYY